MGRVAVTGAGGFLGRALCPQLTRSGWEVEALDRSRADVTDYDALAAAVDQADAVVHLAFPTRRADRQERPFECLDAVLSGTANVLRLAAERGAAHLVLASSGKVYGPPTALPVSEDHPLAPDTQLGALKRVAESVLEQGLKAVAADRRLGVSTLRIFNVYGPGQREDFVLPYLVSSLRAGGMVRLGELDHRRDYVHLADTCAAFVTALEHPAEAGALRALNVGSGRSASVRELLAALGELAGAAPEVVQEETRRRPGEAPEERADVTRLEGLGWSPRKSLAEGVAQLWEEEGAPS